jgi:hypothetical protein
MGGKAKSRCRLGMLKVNKLRRSYLNVMKLENYGATGECLIIITKPHKSCILLGFFTITFKIQKVQKWQTPFWNPHKKNQIKYYVLRHFWLPNKKETNVSCASKQLQVCFPLAG